MIEFNLTVLLLLLLPDLGNARVIIEAVLLIETITPSIDDKVDELVTLLAYQVVRLERP